MLAETSLKVSQHGKTGIYAITRAASIQNPKLVQKPIEKTEMNVKNKIGLEP